MTNEFRHIHTTSPSIRFRGGRDNQSSIHLHSLQVPSRPHLPDMVSTRARGGNQTSSSDQAPTGSKRSAPSAKSSQAKPATKKAKNEKDGKLKVGDDGEVGLKTEDPKDKNDDQEERDNQDDGEVKNKDGEVEVDRTQTKDKAKNGAPAESGPVASDNEDEKQEVMRSGQGKTKQEVR